MSVSSFIARVGVNPYWITANAHFWFAAALVLGTHLLGGNAQIAVAIIAIAAAAKEFWFDARYEVPKQTFLDNATDFAGYVAGAVLALTICG